MRCSGVRRCNQKYVSISSFRCKLLQCSGKWEVNVVVSVVVEEESKKIREINFKRCRSYGVNV